MDKYVIAPPSGSNNNSVGAADAKWKEGYFEKLPNWQEYLAESTGYGIVSGSEPTISGLTVTVGAGIVHLADGTRKELSATNITLDTADSTNPRIDLVYIDSNGVVAKVTGTAAASPVVPTLPSGGISVCNVTIAAGSTTGTINRVQTIAPNLANYGVVNVKDFGAKGDGVTDDTEAIQAAINAAMGSAVFFPAGHYIVSGTLQCDTANKYVNIFGVGKNSKIEYTANSGNLIQYTHCDPYNKINIEKIQLYCANQTGTALYFNGSVGCCNTIIKDCWFVGFAKIIEAHSECDEWTVTGNYFYGYGQCGIETNDLSGGWYISSNHFQGGAVGSYGVIGNNLHDSNFMTNTIQSLSCNGLYIKNGAKISVIGMYQEMGRNGTEIAFRFEDCKNLLFHMCTIGGIYDSIYHLTGCSWVSIIKSTYTPSGGYANYYIYNDETCSNIFDETADYRAQHHFLNQISSYYQVNYVDDFITSVKSNVIIKAGKNVASVSSDVVDLNSYLKNNAMYLVSIYQNVEGYKFVGVISKNRNSVTVLNNIVNDFPTAPTLSTSGVITLNNSITATRSFLYTLKRLL